MEEKLHFGYNKDYNIGYTGDYLDYLISTEKNVLVLDGELSIDEIEKRIWDWISPYFL